MSETNGKSAPPQPFALTFGGNFVIAPRKECIERMVQVRQSIPPTDLRSGPVYDELIDAFRSWSLHAEPPMIFMSQECKMACVRVSAYMPPYQFVSSGLAKSIGVKDGIEARINANEPGPPAETDEPRLFTGN